MHNSVLANQNMGTLEEYRCEDVSSTEQMEVWKQKALLPTIFVFSVS